MSTTQQRGRVLPRLIAAAVVLGLAYIGVGHVLPWLRGALADRAAATWSAGACAAPDADPAIRYRPTACDDPDAALTVLAMGEDPVCPPGTDVLINVAGRGVACLRNRSDDHPGDPGRGGGQLLVGDCLAPTAPGAPVSEAPCSGSADTRVVAMTPTRDECPPETTDTVPVDAARGYRVICVVG